MTNTNDGLEVAMSALPETHHTGETSSFLRWQLNLSSPFNIPLAPEPQTHPLHIASKDNAAVDEPKLWRWIRLHPRAILFVMICLARWTAVLIPVVAVFSVKYKDANAKFEEAAFVVSYSNLTNGCTDNPGGTTGNTFISSYGNGAIYTMYCNKDTTPPAMFSLFAGSFNSCMESCTV
ncbi:hypothetical protein BKA56DRAFT_587932 [Ilyonectria sp. MPI-CAGE-AT-0026]|nr:hypothetical protein BKA56DRAFT_587932 [Ilyonectria sp. MPI-CAGE-AT-0026]